MPGMKKSLVIYTVLMIVAMLAAEAETATVYVEKDKKGVTKYTDKPSAKSKQAVLPRNTIIAPLVNTDKPKVKLTPKTTPINYSINIISPADQESIHSAIGELPVSGQVVPQIDSTNTVQFYINGSVAYQGNSSTFVLKDVPRGELKLKMKLTDQKGKVIASSKTITVYMRRPSIIGK